MLVFAGSPSLPALHLLVLHDDAQREFDYITGVEKALEAVAMHGWIVVSMQHDWGTIFVPAT